VNRYEELTQRLADTIGFPVRMKRVSILRIPPTANQMCTFHLFPVLDVGRRTEQSGFFRLAQSSKNRPINTNAGLPA
jgi:hypothetical protein